MYHTLRQILKGDQIRVVEQFSLPERPSEHKGIPRFLFKSRVGLYLYQRATEHGWPEALWSHQASALGVLGRGDNIVVSTGTASGKSLIFRTFALHKCLLESDSRVLVFYPLKALAADQIRGWKQMANELGIEADRYLGLLITNATTAPVLIDSESLIVTPEAAALQKPELEREPAPEPGSKRPSDGPIPPDSNGAPQDTKPTRFIGRVAVSADRPARDIHKIVEGIVEQLTVIPGSTVSLEMEIDAEVPDGLDSGKVRTLVENANTLGFTEKTIR